MPECAVSPLTIRLFGSFDVRVGGERLPRLRSHRGPWLLSLLVLRHGGEVERAWLAGTLWPDSPQPQAMANLRNSLSDLRRALGPEAFRLRSPTGHSLSLDLAGAQVDLVAFDQAIAAGDASALERAAALYRGPLLEGCAETWAFQERQVREQAYLRALETLAARAEETGDPAAGERYLRLALAADPLRETAHRALMHLLAAGGNYAAATPVYRELRLLLHRELNTAPDPETQALFEQISAQARERAGIRSQESGVRRDTDRDGPALDPVGPDPRPPIPDPYGTVTFLFTDIEGSSRLWEQHPEAMEAALARHDALAAQIVPRHEGRVVKHRGEGDSLFAVFARAIDAVHAAAALQRGVGAEPWPAEIRLRVRIALHTGDAVVREGDYFGPAVNRCARLRAAAHGGQILLSLSTQELVRDVLPEGISLHDLGEHRLKDLARPERIFQVLAPDLESAFPPLRSLSARRNNLPAQPTPLIGRESEVAAVCEQLRRETVRLVTLTGTGGTGKTRLGLQVAADLLEEFEDGVFFVPLAPISDPALVASAIAQTLGVRESAGRALAQSLQEVLQEKQLLLLLDNFEQVLEAAPLVAELLAGAPRLKVIVTSRAALHLRGEREFPVSPLALPPLPVSGGQWTVGSFGDARGSETPSPSALPSIHCPLPTALSQYASVELFIQRALDVKPDFAVTNENAPAVAEICHRLDGLPLAIELAAARIRVLSPEAILTRLGSRLALLTGGPRDLPERQRTLRSAIAWSYELLDEAEKTLFGRLSVFVDGCTLEAVQAVCEPEGSAEIAVLDGVASLVEKNLLRQGSPRLTEEGSGGGEPRFGMYETIREYAGECLVSRGEEASIRRRHARFFLRVAEAGKRADKEIEHGNLRAALTWAVHAREAEIGLRLGEPMWRFWIQQGYLTEGRERLTVLLGLEEASGRTIERARVLFGAGALAHYQSDYPAARSHFEESLTIFRDLEDPKGVTGTLMLLGQVARDQGDYELARSCHLESLSIHREAEAKGGIALELAYLGLLAHEQDDDDAALALLEESEALHRETGNTHNLALSLNHLGSVVRKQGDLARARSLHEEALAMQRPIPDKNCGVVSLYLLGRVAKDQGDLAGAAALYSESLAMRHELGLQRGIAECLEGLAGLAVHRDPPCSEVDYRARWAAQLFGAAAALREAIGAPLAPAEREEQQRDLAAVRAALGEGVFAAAWTDGRRMSSEQAVVQASAAADFFGPLPNNRW